MTPAQHVAITHACLLSIDTVHPRFSAKSGRWSRVLTVNTGYE